MSKPLDEDWNNLSTIEEEMTDAGKAVPVVDVVPNHGSHSLPKQAKGGTFAPADIPVIKRALHVYLMDCMRMEGYSDRDPHPDLHVISNLLHRLGRIA